MTQIPAWVDGTLTPVDKLEVHQRGLRHKAVSIFVMDGTRVLIQQRALNKYHTPGLWANTCCTHPHWGETPQTCAIRRLSDELGIAGVPVTYRDQLEYRADVGGGLVEHEVVDLFTAQVDAETLMMSPNPEEVMATRWVDIHELADEVARTSDLYTPWLRIYLADHLAAVLDGT
ncbi:isopentenyl-diphosphate Delta-isomerase [Thalassorhabdomicrobium marinisediminis]|uniref:Isopentenyl-diphosphate Delta-isomerase n=1 Tax=Thalassorhabdomicrobium marinisediminis TaxID=2170577 RepID=A0A2T7FZM8_9RHOB|nr:isopentenyl-diphosphate Delta-isomerase [Thalassorhabdomicrobium marinisediminis]PVA07627.1 isopentenyl-diphosphate delta-isomerase [Thalassorhabdomicrobium marinisediminis]